MTLHKCYSDPSTDGVVGAVKSVDSPEGVVNYSTDILGRRTQMSSTLNSKTLTVDYTYNTKGLADTLKFTNPVTSVQETFAFTYDSTGRLTLVDSPTSVDSSYLYNSTTSDLMNIAHSTLEVLGYKYDDSTGMVNGMSRGGVEPLMPSIANSTYDDANRMTALNKAPITYDNNGNSTEMDGMILSWNQKGQLTGIVNAPQ